MTVCLSPHFDPKLSHPGKLLAILDHCEQQGIRLIIDDPRARWHGSSTNPKSNQARFSEACRSFGHHPAVFGFYIGDQPHALPTAPRNYQFDEAAAAYRTRLSLAHELIPFRNQNPAREDSCQDVWLANCLEQWARRFASLSRLRVFSYDNDSQLDPRGPEELGINQSLYRAKIPFWGRNLCVGHFRLHRVALIDEHREPSETLSWLSRVQRPFQHTFGALMAELKHDETYLCQKVYGGYELFVNDKHPIVYKVQCNEQLPILRSFFHSQNDSGYLPYHSRRHVHGVCRIPWRGEEVDAA